jgi:hypothetical protein
MLRPSGGMHSRPENLYLRDLQHAISCILGTFYDHLKAKDLVYFMS